MQADINISRQANYDWLWFVLLDLEKNLKEVHL